MKKFLAVLVLLVLIAGVVFYFGWVQIRLPEHTYGVIFTKTTGYHPEVVRPGTFVWKWERLIPTNFTLHRFTIEPRTVQLSQTSTLPSGDVYAQVLEESPSFEYHLDVSFRYELIPEKLPKLVEEQALNPEKLDSWYQEQAEAMLSDVKNILSREVERLDDSSPTELQFGALEEKLRRELESSYPSVTIHEVVPRRIEFPDLALYYSARELYFSLLDTREVTETETLRQARSWMVSEESKLKVLREYGELFTEYPGLIRYLALKDQQSIENMVPQIELLEKVFGQESTAAGAEANNTQEETQ